jgi:hypothetical protein
LDAPSTDERPKLANEGLGAVLIVVGRRVRLEVHQEVQAVEVVRRREREWLGGAGELCGDGAEGRDRGGDPTVARGWTAGDLVALQTPGAKVDLRHNKE